MLDPEKAHERRWWSLAVICMSLMVITVDNSILNIALPTIVRDLHATGSDLQWMVDSYIIVFASLLLVAGALGDKYGRKGALSTGLVIFGVFSALASVSTSPLMLTAMRGLMGVGAAFMFPTTLSIITNVFVGAERARAIGIWAAMAGVGVAVGPLAGGVLVEHFSWGAVFLVNVPICVAALVLGHFLVPTSRDPSGRPFDPIGSLLSVLTLFGIIYAVIEAPQLGWSAPEVVGSFIAGLAFLYCFGRWERRCEHPMLDLTVFRNPRFSAAAGILTLTTFALQGAVFLGLQYFQFYLGYTPSEAGLLSIPVALGLVCTATNAPRLVFRWGTKRVVTAGLLLLSASFATFASDAVMSTVVGAVLARLVSGIGLGLVNAPATESVMGSLPKSRAGVGSAINDTSRQVGSAFGVAVIGSLMLAFYHHFATATSNLSATSRAALHDSIGRALVAARSLRLTHADQAADLAARGRSAFLDAMRLTYPISAALIALAAYFAWRWLPAHAPAHEIDDETTHDQASHQIRLEPAGESPV